MIYFQIHKTQVITETKYNSEFEVKLRVQFHQPIDAFANASEQIVNAVLFHRRNCGQLHQYTQLEVTSNFYTEHSMPVFLNQWAVDNFQWVTNLVIFLSFSANLYNFIIIQH